VFVAAPCICDYFKGLERRMTCFDEDFPSSLVIHPFILFAAVARRIQSGISEAIGLSRSCSQSAKFADMLAVYRLFDYCISRMKKRNYPNCQDHPGFWARNGQSLHPHPLAFRNRNICRFAISHIVYAHEAF